MHIGLFGGTFNPIHSGHIHASQEVKKAFSLDKIYLIPSALPPHKNKMASRKQNTAWKWFVFPYQPIPACIFQMWN